MGTVLTQAPLQVPEGRWQPNLTGRSTALAEGCPQPWAPCRHHHGTFHVRAQAKKVGQKEADPGQQTGLCTGIRAGEAAQVGRGAAGCWRPLRVGLGLGGHLQMILGGLQGVQALPGWLHLSPRTLEVRMHHFLPGCQLGRSKWQVVLNPKCSTNSRKSRAGGN